MGKSKKSCREKKKSLKSEEEEVDTSTEEDSAKEQRKYKPYFVSDYNRRMRTVVSATGNFCDTEADLTAEHIIFNCPAYAIERLLHIEKLIQIYENSESVPRAVQDVLRNTKTYLALCNFIHSTVKEI
ncbi:unnamed protein product [Parnassius apollo]|uniref:(apollo) hypothetical protein n=1 Tax=Parnassius apollo TaxID=110799 RepID=A0A8S3X2G7_PARAO|nr:unnamed protein product [Parnassius apollo]